MNIVVYNPQTEEDIKELGRKAAMIHNQVLLQSIKQLSCPNNQKQALLDAIQKETLSQRSTQSQ